MLTEQSKQKEDEDFCQPCPHGHFDSAKGLFGGYHCFHPDNVHPEHWPMLHIDVFKKLLKCEFTDRSRPVKEIEK